MSSASARKPLEEQPEIEDDPVWAAFMRAPLGPPDTEEQRRIIEAARSSGVVPGHVVTAEIAERCRRGE
jgi:hypothetical protein